MYKYLLQVMHPHYKPRNIEIDNILNDLLVKDHYYFTSTILRKIAKHMVSHSKPLHYIT